MCVYQTALMYCWSDPYSHRPRISQSVIVRLYKDGRDGGGGVRLLLRVLIVLAEVWGWGSDPVSRFLPHLIPGARGHQDALERCYCRQPDSRAINQGAVGC